MFLPVKTRTAIGPNKNIDKIPHNIFEEFASVFSKSVVSIMIAATNEIIAETLNVSEPKIIHKELELTIKIINIIRETIDSAKEAAPRFLINFIFFIIFSLGV
jgi:L-cystine uptake protein TcyP (sodium:dicarboxylate symporter family)